MAKRKSKVSGVKVIDRGWDVKVAQWIKEPGSRDVQAGVFDPVAAQRAHWAEFGTATQPERPMMRQVLDANSNIIDENRKKVAEELANGTGKAKQRMEELGEYLVSAMREAIDNHSTEANAPSTEKQKGFNWPWVESGETYDKISYRIVSKKK